MPEQTVSMPLEQQWNRLLDNSTTIESLMTAYPDIWNSVSTSVNAALTTDNPEDINGLIAKADLSAKHWYALVSAAAQGGRRNKIRSEAIPHLVKSRMIHLSIQKVLMRSLQGGVAPVQQNSFDKMLCNILFYFPYRDHRPVNVNLLRLLWPLVRDKHTAIAKAKSLGIYCFFTNAFLDYLMPHLLGKKVLEIAAGSGVLTLLLKKRGIDCIATDDLSWNSTVHYGRHVENLDAAASLKHYLPDVVLCSWPPPENQFESAVFSCSSVDQYIVVGSRHRFATGARKTYEQQSSFLAKTPARPDRLIAPSAIESEILHFTRISKDCSQ